jgi:nitrite reductase (NADH) small subunit
VREKSQQTNKESDMTEQQWKMVCRIKDVPVDGVRLVQRGLAWQELPGVELRRNELDQITALLEGGSKRFDVRIEDAKIYLDLNELKPPASRADAALAGAFAVAAPPIF